jgi:hypothetical protein
MAPVHGKISAAPVAPRTVYFKRFYKDGSVRPARLRVNGLVAQHLERQNGDACRPLDKSMRRRSADHGTWL